MCSLYIDGMRCESSLLRVVNNIPSIVMEAWETLTWELLFLENCLTHDVMGHKSYPEEWLYLRVGDLRLSLEIVWGPKVLLKSRVSLRLIPWEFVRPRSPNRESCQSKIPLKRREIQDQSIEICEA